jgi:hypothetical protein
MNADGSDPTRLTFSDGANNDFFNATEPAWSPSGASIAFIYVLVSSGTEIFTIKPDGSELTRVTTDDIRDASPDWQPIPNRPPDCTAVTATPDVHLQPHRRFVTVRLAGATDADGDPVVITIDHVEQDEPVRAKSDHTAPDARRAGAPDAVQLRAERDPKGDGRVYRIHFTAEDGRGSSCSGTVAVSVPRHKHKPAVDSAPPSFDSFGR